ncbi:MAG: FISUMP domain-containing protein, partial [Candidatus Saccharibacteria bacterium]|nr:FISUMP domain-containing protein [Candidatus Saccharibacteria bacterium]
TITGKATPIGYCDNNNIADANCMQRMTASACTTTAKTVYDDRDGSAYLVQKLADGKCWLLDNLRLGSTGFASGVTELNSTNTNTTKSIATSTFASWNTTSGFNSYTAPMINTASADTTTTGYGSGSKKIGVYYNYCAATMQSYCYASGSGTGNASQDVCPKGWRMPTGGSSGEYKALYTAYSSNATNFRNALSTPLPGFFGNSSVSLQGNSGYFWSSSMYGDGNSMYDLYVNSSGVDPKDYNGRIVGFSVRCVLETRTIADVTYMQEVNSAVVANTAEGATATLRDQRDNQNYTVAKINGNLWMTRNLAIGCNGSGSSYGSSVSSKSLTSTYSNVSSSWSTPTALLSAASHDTEAADYTTPRMQCSSSYGAWYNYAAASAGTITGDSNNTDATKDICPAGWRLPTSSERGLVFSYSSAFNPVAGGEYANGSLIGTTTTGFWWSATAANTTLRHGTGWTGSLLGSAGLYRYRGYYVRCIRS